MYIYDYCIVIITSRTWCQIKDRSETGPWITADFGTLKQALENLFDNSLPALLYILVLPPPAAAIFGCPEMSIIPLEITLPGFVFTRFRSIFQSFFRSFSQNKTCLNMFGFWLILIEVVEEVRSRVVVVGEIKEKKRKKKNKSHNFWPSKFF